MAEENGTEVICGEVEEKRIESEGDTTKIPLLAQLVYGTYTEDKSKLILEHDHGVGSPCAKCQNCCGLELHFWRKICKNCGCKVDDHDIKVNESIHEAIVYNLLHMNDDLSSIEFESDDEELQKHPILKDFCRKKDSVETKQSRVLPPPVAKKPGGERKISVQITSGGEVKTDDDPEPSQDQVEQPNAKADEKRKQSQLLMRQIPAQDFDPKYCHELDDFEKKELKYFRFLVQEEAIGKGVTKFNNFEHDIACEHCDQSVSPRSPYKFVDRLPGQQWHTDCFKCKKCENLLAGSIYFVHENNIYCGRHYAENLKNRCAACDELVFSEKFTNAEDRFWHTKHFCCYKCDDALANKYYVIVENQPYCVPCYHDDVADRCLACEKPIEAGTERVNFQSYNWHVNSKCFACTECRKSLVDIPFIPSGEKMFCSQLCVGVYSV